MVRRRTTPARRSRSLLRTSVVATVIVVAVVATLPAASFSTGSLDRGTNIDVTRDVDGVLSLDKADSIAKNQRSRLVTIANNFTTSITVEIILNNEEGDVYFGEDTRQPSNSDSIAPGSSVIVEVDLPNNTGIAALNYTVTASAPEVYIEATRSTAVRSGQGGSGCPGNSQNCNS